MKSWMCAAFAASSICLLRRVDRAVGDVVADRRGEQEDVLLHDADRLAQRGERDVADVDAVDRDAAAGDVVEARHQVDDRRLAAARRAHERDHLAGLGVDVDVAQDGADGVVAEGDVLETHVALGRPRSSTASGFSFTADSASRISKMRWPADVARGR